MVRIKHASNDVQVHSIIAKHVAAMSREITDELTRTLLGRIDAEIPEDASSASAFDDVRAPGPTQPAYYKRTRKWGCGRCLNYFDLRKRAVTAHMRFCPGALAPISAVVREKFAPRTPTKPAKSRKKKTSP